MDYLSKNNFSRESPISDATSREAIEEEVAFLREQVESCKQERVYAEQQVEAYRQALEYISSDLKETNQELCKALKVEQLEFSEAKELAKGLMSSGKSMSESLAELLSTIYRFPVQATDLETKDLSSLRSIEPLTTIQNKNHLIEQSQIIRQQTRELKAQADDFRKQSRVVKAQASRVTKQAKTLKGVLNMQHLVS